MAYGSRQLSHGSSRSTPSCTEGAYESSKTFVDLADICTKNGSARVTYNLFQGFEDATCGIKPQNLNVLLVLECHLGKAEYHVCFKAKGQFFTCSSLCGQGTVLALPCRLRKTQITHQKEGQSNVFLDMGAIPCHLSAFHTWSTRCSHGQKQRTVHVL